MIGGDYYCQLIHCRLPHSTAELTEQEAVLRQKIERLKKERAAISLPKSRPGAEGEICPRTGHQAALRGGHLTKDNVKLPDAKKEKASLFYDLISVRVGE